MATGQVGIMTGHGIQHMHKSKQSLVLLHPAPGQQK